MNDSIVSKEAERFTQVSNRAVRDDELGAVSLAIYTYIRSHNSQTYKIYKKNVQARFKEIGRVSFDRAWKALIDKGWVESERVQDSNGRYTAWEHRVAVENDDYVIVKNGKSVRVTDMHPDDIRSADSRSAESRLDDTLKNTNTKNNKSKKTNTKMQNVSNDTLDEIWVELSRIWKLSNSPVGNKQKAISSLKKLNLTDELLYRKLVTEAEKHSAAVRELNNSGKPDLNLPNVTTWVNQRRWEQTVTDYYSVNKQKTPPGSAQPPQNQGMRQIRKL